MSCAYCGADDWSGARCARCGAEKNSKPAQPKPSVLEPTPGLFWNGHWVITDSSMLQDTLRFRFYLGPELMAVLPIDRRLLYELFGDQQPGESSDRVMAFIWELYLVAVGERKEYVLQWAGKNKGIRETFYHITVCRPEPDTNEWSLVGLNLHQLRALAEKV